MTKRCYYETLGVARNASGDDIKSAFRKLAKQCHPDSNPSDDKAEHRFKELNEAYDVLKDGDKRAAYDRYGHAAFEGAAGAQARGFGADFSASFADVFDDLFGEFMGSRRGTRARGADLRYNLEISLEEAFAGKPVTLRVPGAVPCEACGGSGAESGTKPQTCSTCSGLGRVRAQQGFFTIERTCPSCQGQGRMIKDPCRACAGTGRQEKERTLSVNIPQGVEDGTRIRLAGEGELGFRGAPPGDLYIFLSVKPHPFFERHGQDLHCRVPIPLITAALGGHVEVPTLGGGRARVTVPEGTQSGHRFRVKGKGMPVLRGARTGDLHIHCAIETPVRLSRKQKELLREFEKASSDDNSPETAGFFKRVKEFFDGAKG
jgi:molecular chaperone DnaJ